MKNRKTKFAGVFAAIMCAAILAIAALPVAAFADSSAQVVKSGWNEVTRVDDGFSYGWKLYATVTIEDGIVTDVVIAARGNNMPQVPETERPYWESCHLFMEDYIVVAEIDATNPDAVDAVDTVTGATHTSNTIKKAVKEALVKWNLGRDLGNATVSLSPTSFTYSGAALKPAVTVTSSSGISLTQGVDYTVVYANNTNAGTAQITVTAVADSNYVGSKTATFTIAPKSQTIKAAKTYKVKFAKVKKAKQTVAVKFTADGGGKITYAAAKNGKVSIAKNGKVTVKKGAKKGTYTLKVKVTAAAKGKNYAKTTTTVPLKVKVA